MSKYIIVVVLLQCLCFTETARFKRVIGGKGVPCGTQPHIGSLRNATQLRHLCGVTILSPNYALTAAHCVYNNADQYTIVLNNVCSQHRNYPTVGVLEIIVHPLYDRESKAHDISLLRISLSNDISWLQHDILPVSSFGLSGDCTIYGYGYKERNVKEVSEELLAGPLKIVSLDMCVQRLGPYIAPKSNDGMLCAWGNGIDSCQGDSGGPLICKGLVEGVTSYGVSCGIPRLPGVYTHVGAHVKWIRDIMNKQI